MYMYIHTPHSTEKSKHRHKSCPLSATNYSKSKLKDINDSVINCVLKDYSSASSK